MTQKHCSKCGKTFNCSADARGCWCESYSVSTENLQLLKREFDNCLCPACLSQYSEGNVLTEEDN